LDSSAALESLLGAPVFALERHGSTSGADDIGLNKLSAVVFNYRFSGGIFRIRSENLSCAAGSTGLQVTFVVGGFAPR